MNKTPYEVAEEIADRFELVKFLASSRVEAIEDAIASAIQDAVDAARDDAVRDAEERR